MRPREDPVIDDRDRRRPPRGSGTTPRVGPPPGAPREWPNADQHAEAARHEDAGAHRGVGERRTTDQRPSAGERRGAAPVAGLLLAAGGGSRLGGRPKALLEYRGRTLVERGAELLAAAGCSPVHVVLGAWGDVVLERAGRPDWVPVVNPYWARGMGSSLRAGLAALRATAAPAALVALVDQPRIGVRAMARVLAAHRAGAHLAAATYQGRRGHPVLLAREHWDGVAASARGDRGARDYLRRHRAALTLVECGDVAAPDDVDHPADPALLTAGEDRTDGDECPDGADRRSDPR